MQIITTDLGPENISNTSMSTLQYAVQKCFIASCNSTHYMVKWNWDSVYLVKVLDSTVVFFDEKIFSWTQRTLQMAGLILCLPTVLNARTLYTS